MDWETISMFVDVANVSTHVASYGCAVFSVGIHSSKGWHSETITCCCFFPLNPHTLLEVVIHSTASVDNG